jgi:hypothetical protein
MKIMAMTIHEALSRLKVMESKLDKAANATFVVANRHNNSKIDGKSISDKVVELTAAKQRFDALTKNYRMLKSAIAMSNANTTITIGEKNFTIVEAIEEKHFAEKRAAYLRYMRRNYEMAQNLANANNAKLPEAAERFVAPLNMSEKNGNSKEDIKKTMDQYIVDNTWELVDPNDMADYLKKMEDELTEFTSNIDFKLSESNATTVIDVDLIPED